MSYGFQEKREVRMEPGPDGKLEPHVYIERRPLSKKEAEALMKDQAEIFSGFDGLFSGMDGLFAGFDKVFKNMTDQMKTFMKDHGKGQMGPRS